MFEWIKVWFLEATRQTVELPLHAAAPLMVVVGAIDSSLLSLPEVNDYITVARIAHLPHEVLYFPLFPAIGSVIGSFVLYRIARGGERLLAFHVEVHFARHHHEDSGRVGMDAGGELGAGRGRVVGGVLFGIEDDLLRPVVLASVHLLEVGQFPQRPHRRLVDAALGLAHPPIFRRAARGLCLRE